MLLGFDPDTTEPVTADRQSAGGRRPIHAAHAQQMLEADLASGRQADGAVPVDRPYVSDFFARADAPILDRAEPPVPDSADDPILHLLSRFLPSSFVVGFGSEHFTPWPRLLVAPLAPGWIGGFMSASSYF